LRVQTADLARDAQHGRARRPLVEPVAAGAKGADLFPGELHTL
jgi:hypothetical protein